MNKILLKGCKILVYKVIFQWNLQILFLKNVRLGDQLLLLKYFENFYFLNTLCPIFVDSVKKFGRSDNDMIV